MSKTYVEWENVFFGGGPKEEGLYIVTALCNDGENSKMVSTSMYYMDESGNGEIGWAIENEYKEEDGTLNYKVIAWAELPDEYGN